MIRILINIMIYDNLTVSTITHQPTQNMNTEDKIMTNYIDGFILSIPRIYIDEYKKAAEKVAEIWKEYGAIAYYEFVGDDM